jgi:branched-chain amino acid transport system substrate-binding protein
MEAIMKKSSSAILSLLVIFSIFMLALDSTDSAAAQEPIKIGALLPLSGPAAATALGMKYMMQQAEVDINEGGGVIGRPIEVIILDDELKVDKATTLARKLIVEDKVVGLVGGMASAEGLAMAAVAQELKVPVVGLGMADKGASPVNPYGFVYLSLNYYAVRSMLERIQALGHSKIGYYYTDTAWGTGGLSTLEGLLAQPDFKDLKLVAKEGTPLGATEVSLQVMKLKSAGAQSVIILNYDTESAAFYRAINTMGWKPHTISVIGAISAVLGILPADQVAGAEAVDWFTAEKNPGVASLIARGKKRFPEWDERQGMSYVGYDEVWMLCEAIKRSGSTDPQVMRDTLEKIKDWHAPSIGMPGSVGGFGPDDHAFMTGGPIKVVKPDGSLELIGGEPNVTGLKGFK